MAELQTEMTPLDGQISNDVPGQVRVGSQTSGGSIIVTDEATLSNGLGSLAKNELKIGSYVGNEGIDATSTRSWTPVFGKHNITWNSSNNKTISSSSGALRIISTNSDNSNSPTLDLTSNLDSSKPVFSLEFVFKTPDTDVVTNSGYGQWPGLLSIMQSDGSCFISLGYTKATGKLDMHVKGSGSNSYNQYGGNNFTGSIDYSSKNTIKLIVRVGSVDIYLNGNLELTCPNVLTSITDLGKVVIGDAPRHTATTKLDFFNINVYNRELFVSDSDFDTDGLGALVKGSVSREVLDSSISTLNSSIESLEEDTKSQILDGSIEIFTPKTKVPGMDPLIEASPDHCFCIPNAIFLHNGTLCAFADDRSSDLDEVMISIAGARSTFWNKWELFTAIQRDPWAGSGTDKSRIMDSTTVNIPPHPERPSDTMALDLPGRTIILAGRWERGSSQWASDAATRNSWTGAMLVIDDSGMTNIVDGVLNPTSRRTIGGAGCDVVISGFPSNCKGFIGGVGNGIWTHDSKVVFPIQWVDGNGTVHAGIIYSSDEGESWTWGAGTCNGVSENMVFERNTGSGYELIMIARQSSTNDYCKVFSCSDTIGSSWTDLSDVGGRYHEKIKHGGVQGSVINVPYDGQDCIIMSRPSSRLNTGGDAGTRRREFTIWAIKDNGVNVDVKPIVTLTKRHGRHYGSLAYCPFSNGIGRLVVAYETQPEDTYSPKNNTIRIKDLTEWLPAIKNHCAGNPGGGNGVDQDARDLANAAQQTATTAQQTATDAAEKAQRASDNVNSIKNKVDVIEQLSTATPTKEGLICRFNRTGLSEDLTRWIDEINGLELTTYGNGDTSCLSVDPEHPDMVKMTMTSSSKIGYRCDLANDNKNPFKDCTVMTINITVKFNGPMDDSHYANWSHLFNMYVPNGNSPDYKAAISMCGVPTNQSPVSAPSDKRTKLFGWEPKGLVANKNKADYINKPITLDKRQVISVVYGSSDYKVYLDGELVKTLAREGSDYQFSGLSSSVMCLGGKARGEQNGGQENPYDLANWSVGELCFYNREMTPEEIKSYVNEQQTSLKNIGNLDNLGTPEKSTLVDAINSVYEAVESAVESTDNVKRDLSLIGLSYDSSRGILPSESIAIFEEGANVNISGNQWTDRSGAKNIAWTSHSGYPTITKEGNYLQLDNTGNNTTRANFPKISLNSDLAGATGITVMGKFKLLDISSLDEWPTIFSLSKNGSTGVDIAVLGFTRNDSATNFAPNWHINNDFTNSNSYNMGNARTSIPVTDFIDFAFVLGANSYKFYFNGEMTRSATLSSTNDISLIGELILGYSNRFGRKTKLQFKDIYVAKRELTIEEIKIHNNSANEVMPEWYKDIIVRLKALEVQP